MNTCVGIWGLGLWESTESTHLKWNIWACITVVFCSIWKREEERRGFDSFVYYHYSHSMEGSKKMNDLALAV